MRKINALSMPLKAIGSYCLMILLIIAACKKDQSTTDDANIKLSELKNWYNTEKAKSMGRSQIPLELTPVWDKMTILEDKEHMIYEVEIVNPNHVFTADKKIDNTKYKEYEKRNSFRLVLIKDKKTSVVSGAYMNIVSGNDSQNIQDIHYKKAASFTGIIQYYNIDGSYNLGWHYTNGAIDKKFIARVKSASGAMTEKEPACGVFPVMGTICAGGDDDPPVCYTSVVGTFEIDCFPIEGGGSTGGGSTGGGNGGDGGGMGPGGSGSGSPTVPDKSKDIIDSLAGYPCAQALLAKLPYLKNSIADSIKSVFGGDCIYNIKFKSQDTLIGKHIDGIEKTKLVQTNGTNFNDGYTFNAVIELNPDVLNYATQEYIIVTMYHEALHAYISAELDRLGTLDFKAKYPDVNPVFVDGPYGRIDITKSVFISEHSTMAKAFLTDLKNAIISFNPSFTESSALALARGGITTLSQTDKDINAAERDTRKNLFKGKKCP